MGKKYTIEDIKKDGICDHSTITHFINDGLLPKLYDDKGNWLIPENYYDVLKKAHDNNICLKYALQNMDIVQTLPDGCLTIPKFASEIGSDTPPVYALLKRHENVPGVIIIGKQKVLQKELVNLCKNTKRFQDVRHIFERLDRNNSDPEAIKFRKQFEAELEIAVEASTTDPEPEPDLSTVGGVTIQDNKCECKNVNILDLINQAKTNLKIVRNIAKYNDMPAVYTRCDDAIKDLNAIDTDSEAVNNFTFMLAYPDDNSKPYGIVLKFADDEGAVS